MLVRVNLGRCVFYTRKRHQELSPLSISLWLIPASMIHGPERYGQGRSFLIIRQIQLRYLRGGERRKCTADEFLDVFKHKIHPRCIYASHTFYADKDVLEL